MYLLLILVFILLTAGIIFWLHRKEVHSREDMIERSTPLGTLDLQFGDIADAPAAAAPEVVSGNSSTTGSTAPAQTASEESSNWLSRVKTLREECHYLEALQICQHHYPRIQAFQQAALILRQQIRALIEENRPATAELGSLYRIAVMADLYRSSNPVKPHKPSATLQSLQDLDFEYRQIGSRYLRLLTKNDIRHLEQLWGKPQAHQHAEAALGESWQALCR